MEFNEIVRIQHARVHTASVGNADLSVQDGVLRDVTEEQVRKRPAPGFNALAWIFWHMTRIEDVSANLILARQPQVFDEDGWVERLGVGLHEVGSGMTDTEVEEFTGRVNVTELLAYRAAVGRRTQEIIRNLQPSVLDETIDDALLDRLWEAGVFGPNAEWVRPRWTGKKKVFTLTHSIIGHSYLHLGQGDDIRGLLGLHSL